MSEPEDLFDQIDLLVQRALDGEDVRPELDRLPLSARNEFHVMLEAQGGRLSTPDRELDEDREKTSPGPGSPIVADFLEAYWQDRAEGRSHDLAHYLERFPGDTEGIARCYFALSSQSGSTQSSSSQRQQLGSYVIQDVLGRGGQAIVYLAFDQKLQRPVALKVFEGIAALGKRGLERFKREARAISKLSHPGLGQVYEADVLDGLPFIAMELVKGKTLAEDIENRRTEADEPASRDQRRQIETRLKVLAQIASALAAAHRAGVIHRDLKPGNIMLREDSSPVLLDFGLAKIEDDEAQGITGTLDLLGTPAYIAPERLQNPATTSTRLEDIYALGVTAFEYVAGRRPFDAPTVEELYRRKLRGDALSLEQAAPGSSKDLAVVIRTAMELEPGRRYQDAEHLAEDLLRIVRNEPVSVRPLAATVKIARWYRRNAVVATLTLLILISLTTFSIVTWRKNDNIENLRREAVKRGDDLARTLDEVQILRKEAVDRGDTLARTLDEVLELSDVKRVEDLIIDARSLWPVAEESLPRMERWIAQAREVVARGDRHREALRELKQRQIPVDEARIREALPVAQRRFEELQSRVRGHRHGETGLKGEAIESAVLVEELLEAKFVEDYKTRVEEMKAASYESATDSWRAELLARLVERLWVLGDEENGLLRAIMERARLAGEIEDITVHEHEAAWKRAARELKQDPRFEGFELEPITGFVPLGKDPRSGLQEFYHFLSFGLMEVPTRNEEGELPRLRHEDGLVMVLLPGGDFQMGAIDDANDPDHDPSATAGELPRHEVELAPFLISKYECWQGAWMRLSGGNPSAYKPGSTVLGRETVTPLHPVEFVTWYDARKVLSRFDLELPTEAQWEFAARAGQRTIWSFGNDPKAGAGRINIVDKCLGELGGAQLIEGSGIGMHDDGWALHGPVNLYEPNAYGLYQMHGNVYEWCLDSFASYHFAVRKDDGLRLGTINDNDMRMFRGGAYGYSVFDARSTARSGTEAASPNEVVGLRPVFNLRSKGGAR